MTMSGSASDLFVGDDVTTDAFLGGKVLISQPKQGYRAGVDPVLLAATIPAKAGQTVLELGCGAAPGLCCLGARVAGLTLTGVEIQRAYAALGQRNLDQNGLSGHVVAADLTALPDDIKAQRFDHVMANPPYFDRAHGRKAQDQGREMALAGETPLSDWVAVAARRLKPGGYATFVQRVERLPEMVVGFQAHLGSLEILPLAPREGRPPRLVLIRGRKEGKSPFKLHAPILMHQGARHEQDAESYTAQIRAILRDGASLSFPK